MNFDEHYFKSLNYTNYLEREIRYEKMAHELIQYLRKFNVTSVNHFLDYGCAIGFLVNGFRKYGYQCDGYDISEWAKSEAKKYNVHYIPFEFRKFNVMFAFDVFEHMTDESIIESLKTFSSKLLLVRIPCSVNGTSFHLEISKKDPTHINCKTKDQWLSFFKTNGYNCLEKIDLYTIYDTAGVMCYTLIKE